MSWSRFSTNAHSRLTSCSFISRNFFKFKRDNIDEFLCNMIENYVILPIENRQWKVTNLSFLLEMNEQHFKRKCAFAEKRDHAIFVQPESLIYEHMLRCLIWAPCINNSYLTCDRTLSFIYTRNTSSSQWKEKAKWTHMSSLIIRVSKFSNCYFTYI